MALRSGYKGFKKLLGLKMIQPGTLAIDDAVLANTFFPRSEQAVLAAKNLLPITLAGIKSLNSIRVWDGNVTIYNGVTYTVNTDSSGYLTSVETSGTATGFSFLRLCNVSSFNGSFILNGGVAENKIAYIQNETTNTGLAYSSGADSAVVNLSPTANTVNCIIAYNQGASGAATFKPMLRLATDTDPTYTSFAMTNKALTDEVKTLKDSASDQKTAINAIITAATEAADFAAFKTAMGAITPVTRSLSREAVPEADPAEVIKEKTVTKKSTKKTTVKEGE